MNETEQKIFVAISQIRALMFPLLDTTDTTEELRNTTTSITSQLREIVGRRIIKESRNG